LQFVGVEGTTMSSPNSQKLAELCTKTYKEQAIWVLNGYWDEFGEREAETVWGHVHLISELDLARKAEGCALDELQAHRFLERLNETLTVQAMREKLRATGAITQQVKMVALLHYLIFKYDLDFNVLVNAPQGSKEEIEKAQRMLDEVIAAFEECERKNQEATEALREAQAREAESRRRENEARQREEELQAAKAELEEALREVQAQEDAYNAKTDQLKRASEAGGLVQRNKAKNELAQHLAGDPLPLRKAKITQEAAVNKADRAAKAAAESRRNAEEAARQAANARAQSEQAKEAAEEAVEEARRKVAEAEAYFEEAKNKGVPKGAMWFMERELHERKAFLPTAKGGYAKKKVL